MKNTEKEISNILGKAQAKKFREEFDGEMLTLKSAFGDAEDPDAVVIFERMHNRKVTKKEFMEITSKGQEADLFLDFLVNDASNLKISNEKLLKLRELQTGIAGA
jgi:hypothetical protein